MALRNEDRDWITAQISSAVSSLKPHGWKRAVFAVRELGPLATVIAIVVALLGITFGAVYQSVAHVEKETEFRTQTLSRLEHVEELLALLRAQAVVQKYSSLQPQELKNHREELGSIRKSLVESKKGVPGFWPASFQVINLMSVAVAYIHNPHPGESIVKDSSGVRVEKNGDVVVLMGVISNSYFKDSVIRFDPNVRLANVTFDHCVFIFPLQEVPPKPLQTIADTLLRADLSKPIAVSS